MSVEMVDAARRNNYEVTDCEDPQYGTGRILSEVNGRFYVRYRQNGDMYFGEVQTGDGSYPFNVKNDQLDVLFSSL